MTVSIEQNGALKITVLLLQNAVRKPVLYTWSSSVSVAVYGHQKWQKVLDRKTYAVSISKKERGATVITAECERENTFCRY